MEVIAVVKRAMYLTSSYEPRDVKWKFIIQQIYRKANPIDMGKNNGINNYAKIIKLNKHRINYQKKNLTIILAVQVIYLKPMNSR